MIDQVPKLGDHVLSQSADSAEEICRVHTMSVSLLGFYKTGAYKTKDWLLIDV